MGEFDTTQGYEVDEYRSAAAWLRGELHLHPREAGQIVGMARQLRHLEKVDAAFSARENTQAHAGCSRAPPGRLARRRCRRWRTSCWRTSSGPQRLRIATEHLRYCADPNGADRDSVRQYEKRDLSPASTLDGMVGIPGWLDPVSGAAVMAAINALTPPPRDDDPRTAGRNGPTR